MRLRALVVAVSVTIAVAAPSVAGAQTAQPGTAENPTAAAPKLELTIEQRQLIFTSISSRTHRSTAAPPNFLPALDVIVPTAVETLSIPDTVLEVVPKLRGYVCAFVADQALIIDPRSRKVVAVIGSGSGPRNPTAAPS